MASKSENTADVLIVTVCELGKNKSITTEGKGNGRLKTARIVRNIDIVSHMQEAPLIDQIQVRVQESLKQNLILNGQ